MYQLKGMFIIFSLGFMVSICSAATPPSKAKHYTPTQVLTHLKDGNKRFINGHMLHRDYPSEMQSTYAMQHPEVFVLSCMDSRNIPYLAFDQGIGDLFSVRIAGNVLNPDVLGSMEYATQLAGASLIVVMGHDNCGAISGACKSVKLGHLTGLLQKISPAVAWVKKITGADFSCDTSDIINNIAKQNVLNVVQSIPKQSPIVGKLIHQKKVRVIGAMYHLKTGKVEFL